MKIFYNYIELLKKYFFAILSCMLISFIIYYSASGILKRIVEQSLLELAKQSSNLVERELNNQLYILETISQIDKMTDASEDSARMLETLKKFEDGNKHLNLRLTDVEGYTITGTNLSYDISELKYFQKALLGISNYSEPITSVIDGKRVIAFAVPVYQGGQVRYVLSSEYELEGLSEIISGIHFQKYGDAFIVDSDGVIIAHNNIQYVKSQFNIFQQLKKDQRLQRIAELTTHMIKGETGTGQYYFDNMEKYLAYTPVEGTAWSIAVAAPRDIVFGNVNKIRDLLLYSLAALFLAMIVNNTYFYYLERNAKRLQSMSRTAIDVANILIIRIDYDGHIIDLNDHAQKRFGYLKDVRQKEASLFDFLERENVFRLDSIITNLKLGLVEKDFELSMKAADGEIIYLMLNIKKSLPSEIENEIELMGVDITERVKNEKLLREKHEELTSVYEVLAASEEELKQQLDEIISQQQKLRESEERYALVVEASGIGIWDLNMVTKDLYISKRCMEIMGYKNNLLLDSPNIWKNQIHPEDLELSENALDDYLNGTTPFYELDYRVKNGLGGYKWVHTVCKALWDMDGGVLRLAGAHTDITQKMMYEKKIERLAYFDSLTNLYNKASIMERFNEMAVTRISKIALLFMDLDNFKLTNDTYGHAVGDQLLIQIANNLMEIMGLNIVSRFGGDEFVILCSGFENIRDIDKLADNLVRRMDSVFKVNAYSINVSCSVGIAIYPTDADNFDGLLKNADTAMYKAKEKGKNRYEFYNISMNEAIYEKLYIQSYMKTALALDEFKLHYQPLYTARSQKLIGFEALLRWTNPDMGQISPARFIPVAEETRLILPIGDWVLENACRFLKKLHDIGGTELSMSINISILQLQQPDFANRALKVLEQYDLKPESLELEITESVLIQYIDEVADNLSLLENMGVKITLDDFGTGYSSLKYLTQLPISTLKIDKSFIERIGNTEDNRLIIEPIILISRKMGLTTVAEGVENKLQLDYLRKLDCDVIQGYLLGRPQPEETIMELVKKLQKITADNENDA